MPAPDRVATCRFSLFGVSLAIACPEALLPLVCDHLSPWNPRIDLCAPAAPHAAADADADFHIPASHIPASHSPASSPAASADDLLAGLQHWLDREISRRAVDVTPVHAGVVAWRDRAILLPAPSRAGKTTLVRALVAQGARYYSDELAFIDADGRVHAYPRRMMVRDHNGVSRTVLPPETLPPEAKRPGRALHAPPSEPAKAETLPPEALPPLPIGLILALAFDPDAATGGGRAPLHLQPLAASETLLWLLANTPHALTSMRDVPHGLLRAAAAASAWRGTRGAAPEAAAAILRLAESPSRMRNRDEP